VEAVLRTGVAEVAELDGPVVEAVAERVGGVVEDVLLQCRDVSAPTAALLDAAGQNMTGLMPVWAVRPTRPMPAPRRRTRGLAAYSR
jgi:hypothetical protein